MMTLTEDLTRRNEIEKKYKDFLLEEIFKKELIWNLFSDEEVLV